MALARLPRFVAEYVEGGAEEERTLIANRRAFDAHMFAPRVLRDMTRHVRGQDISTGKPLNGPG